MLRKLRTHWISARNRIAEERGASLIEVVVTITLYLAIAGALVYGTIVIENARQRSADETKATISQSGISNSFRDDIANARGIKLNELKNSLTIVKADGKCVSWTIEKESNADSKQLLRTSNDSVAPTNPGDTLTTGITDGTFSYEANAVSLNMKFGPGKDFSESVRPEVAGNDGGGCW